MLNVPVAPVRIVITSVSVPLTITSIVLPFQPSPNESNMLTVY